MIPHLHNAIFKVNNFLESLPSFWIMRSQRSRRRDKGLYQDAQHTCDPINGLVFHLGVEGDENSNVLFPMVGVMTAPRRGRQ